MPLSLIAILEELNRNDVREIVEKIIPDEDRQKSIEDVFLHKPELVHEIAGKLDQPSRVVKYWYDLGLEFKIERDCLDLIERGPNNCNPAEKLLLHAYKTLEPEKATAGEFRRILFNFKNRSDLEKFLDDKLRISENGLQTLDLLKVMRKYPNHFRKVLTSEEKLLTASTVQNLFVPNFSLFGSNKRQKEEEIIMNWNFFVEDVEAGNVKLDVEGRVTTTINLGDVLQFATGSKNIPPEGFTSRLGIMFNHELTERKISSNTCAGNICIPVNKKMESLDSMTREFIDSLVNGQGFGLA